MPLILPEKIPAFELLKDFVFVMGEKRATHQDIRPLKVLIFNLMPTKIETENQLLSLLGNSPLQIEVSFLKTKSYESKNTPKSHLDSFYLSFDDIKNTGFDAAIITGAPVEHMDFEKVDYWAELCEVMNYLKKNATSTMYICWGAMAGLYHFYRIKKLPFKNKLFGIFKHKIINNDLLLSGLDELVNLPHSRHTGLDDKAIYKNSNLKVLLEGKKSGVSVLKDEKDLFILAHPEYSKLTLDSEYKRDLNKGLKIKSPKNYYNKRGEVVVSWRSSASVIFSNWLNFVYQETPFILGKTER
ncbi:homoserine O-succinyltransferase [Campylobacter troglodytis]|uniref:homoserine O-succinyltransferase n=1 Tax=Campylobacter troglodytis TaxID=654363 RepID=UPI001156CA8E|nr:homoserine O-succinyltransferase [Campylobacter troglodytis]TQR60280.1 homoserine O-succinyltransferase [Campylobacter troglodytis]